MLCSSTILNEGGVIATFLPVTDRSAAARTAAKSAGLLTGLFCCGAGRVPALAAAAGGPAAAGAAGMVWLPS